MKIEYLVKEIAGDLPLHPIRIRLTTVNTTQIEAIHYQHGIPLRHSGQYLYFSTEKEATLFMLAYNPIYENW